MIQYLIENPIVFHIFYSLFRFHFYIVCHLYEIPYVSIGYLAKIPLNFEYIGENKVESMHESF
jgi:hypothetical protein